jgi:hypothetical protein
MDTQKDKTESDQGPSHSSAGAGVAFGLALGTAFGIVFDQMVIGAVL